MYFKDKFIIIVVSHVEKEKSKRFSYEMKYRIMTVLWTLLCCTSHTLFRHFIKHLNVECSTYIEWFNSLLEWNTFIRIDPNWLAWNGREIGNNMKIKYKIEDSEENMWKNGRKNSWMWFNGVRWTSAVKRNWNDDDDYSTPIIIILNI